MQTISRYRIRFKKARRDSTRSDYKNYAIQEALKKGNFIQTKNRILQKKTSPSFGKIVSNYIENLKTIHIWNSGQLDTEIGTVYSKISDICERYFHIQNVLREHPRPDFDENYYLNKITDDRKYINLTYSSDKLPEDIHLSSRSDNFQTDNDQHDIDIIYSNEKLNYHNLLNDDRHYVLLTGDGGTGKTTTCKQILKLYTDKRYNDKDSELPIYLSLDKCGTDINGSINKELNINYGAWQSIPGNYLLIIDGLNEINQFIRKDLINQLVDIENSYSKRIKILLATRKISALDTYVIIPFIQKRHVFKIEKLNNDQSEFKLN